MGSVTIGSRGGITLDSRYRTRCNLHKITASRNQKARRPRCRLSSDSCVRPKGSHAGVNYLCDICDHTHMVLA